MSRSFRSITDKEFFKRESDFISELIKGLLESSIGEFSELVKERSNKVGIDPEHDKDKDDDKNFSPDIEIIATFINSPQKHRKDKRSKGEFKDKSDEFIFKEEEWSVFVESEFLFENKSIIDIKWQIDNFVKNGIKNKE